MIAVKPNKELSNSVYLSDAKSGNVPDKYGQVLSSGNYLELFSFTFDYGKHVFPPEPCPKTVDQAVSTELLREGLYYLVRSQTVCISRGETREVEKYHYIQKIHVHIATPGPLSKE